MGILGETISGSPESTCFVCGRPASTMEHVIPTWLQHRFNLWDELLLLPNGSHIPYRQLRVSACERCNNEVYGSLERRVEAGTASEADLWRWANKIHYGLSLKDRFLEWDRRNPGVKIGDVVRSDDPFERSRHFLHCASGDFTVDPDPFGSVFTFRFREPGDFKFAHFFESRSVCVCLGDIGHVVFVEDGQALKRDRATRFALEALPDPPGVHDMLFFFAQSVEHLARHTLGQNIVMGPGLIARLGSTVVHEVRPPNKERFRATCAHLGLIWVDNEEAYPGRQPDNAV